MNMALDKLHLNQLSALGICPAEAGRKRIAKAVIQHNMYPITFEMAENLLKDLLGAFESAVGVTEPAKIIWKSVDRMLNEIKGFSERQDHSCFPSILLPLLNKDERISYALQTYRPPTSPYIDEH